MYDSDSMIYAIAMGFCFGAGMTVIVMGEFLLSVICAFLGFLNLFLIFRNERKIKEENKDL